MSIDILIADVTTDAQPNSISCHILGNITVSFRVSKLIIPETIIFLANNIPRLEWRTIDYAALPRCRVPGAYHAGYYQEQPL